MMRLLEDKSFSSRSDTHDKIIKAAPVVFELIQRKRVQGCEGVSLMICISYTNGTGQMLT